MQNRTKELALFNLGFHSKLRACDLVCLGVGDVCHGNRISNGATLMQRKTKRPVQFEIMQATCESVDAWICKAGLRSEDYLFPSRIHELPHILLGQTKLESTVRYLDIEIDDALELAEQLEV